MYCVVCAPSLTPIVHQCVRPLGRMASFHTRPGTAVPPRSAARVVAARNTVSTIGLDQFSRIDNTHGDMDNAHTNQFSQSVNVYPHEAYEPYVHLATGNHAMIPILIDPTTGVRTPQCITPPGFVPLSTTQLKSRDADEGTTFLQRISQRILHTFGYGHEPARVPPTTPIVHPRVSPIRQPDFDSDQQVPTCASQPAAAETAPTLKAKDFASIQTRLELPEIRGWLVEFESTIGRIDPDAHALLKAPDSSILLSSSGPSWAIAANKRLAHAITACLDSKAPDVVLFKSSLREAESGDRPGIMFSGIDILYEIEALITDRTLGQIKLDTKAMTVRFTPGKSLTDSRLVGDTIKKQFELKTYQERAMPNALLHEIINKFPTSTPALEEKKRKYEEKLYKSEIAGTSPPWTTKILIDYIGVDMASASSPAPRMELSVSERPSAKLTSTYLCAGCGEIGQHLARDCPKKCTSCGFNFCPGGPVRGEVCAVLYDTPPSKRQLKNGIGKDLTPFLVSKLEDAWKLKHPGKDVSSFKAEASSLERCLPSDYDSD